MGSRVGKEEVFFNVDQGEWEGSYEGFEICFGERRYGLVLVGLVVRGE